MRESGNGHHVLCPLCEGRGRMHRSELVAKLANHDLMAKMTASHQRFAKADANQQGATTKTRIFHEEVLTGPVRRILWRRSPKE